MKPIYFRRRIQHFSDSCCLVVIVYVHSLDESSSKVALEGTFKIPKNGGSSKKKVPYKPQVGDRVFVEVKGYPAWHARVCTKLSSDSSILINVTLYLWLRLKLNHRKNRRWQMT